MADRYSEKDAVTAFEQLCVAMGKPIARSSTDVGAWKLETVWPYGHRILEVTRNESWRGLHYGENPVLFTDTRNNRELRTICRDIIRALELYDPQVQHDRFAAYYQAQHEATANGKAGR